MAVISIALLLCLFLCFPWTVVCATLGRFRDALCGPAGAGGGAVTSWLIARYCHSDYYDGAPESAWGWALLAGCLAMVGAASLVTLVLIVGCERTMDALGPLVPRRRPRAPRRSWRRRLPKLCGLDLFSFMREIRREGWRPGAKRI